MESEPLSETSSLLEEAGEENSNPDLEFAEMKTVVSTPIEKIEILPPTPIEPESESKQGLSQYPLQEIGSAELMKNHKIHITDYEMMIKKCQILDTSGYNIYGLFSTFYTLHCCCTLSQHESPRHSDECQE